MTFDYALIAVIMTLAIAVSLIGLGPKLGGAIAEAITALR